MGGQVVANLAAAACSNMAEGQHVQSGLFPTQPIQLWHGCRKLPTAVTHVSRPSTRAAPVHPFSRVAHAPVTQLMRPGGMPAAAKH